MNAGLLKHVAVLTAIFLLLPAPVFSQQQNEIGRSPVEQPLVLQPCTDWNLATDFRRSPDQENPNRDSCGNLDVWHFMSTEVDRQAYTLLSYWEPNAAGVMGLELWHGEPPYGPHVGINASGSDYGLWLVDTINAHPGPVELAVMGWRSPVNGAVSISGSGSDVSPICGGGVGWTIDLNATNLASGYVPNEGSQSFSDGVGGDLLANVSVQQGDMLYLAIDSLGDYCGDGTLTEFSIHLLGSGPGFTASGRVSTANSLALPGVTISVDGLPRIVTVSDGLYALTVYTGTHTITVDSPCLTFSPSERTITVPPDAPDQDFTGRSTCTFLPVVLWRWPPLPGAPALSPISPTSFDSYNLAWTTPANAASYLLQEDSSTTFSHPTTAYSGPSTGWQAQDKSPGTYCYRVQAFNQYGASPWSNARCVTIVERRDTFSNPSSGWPVRNDAIAALGYVSGEYRILAKQAGTVVQAGLGVSAADFRCEVDARRATHIDGTYGITFGASDTGFYLYEVGFGQFRLRRYERWGNTWTTLIPQTQHPAILQGAQPNRLAVVRRGATITLYANTVQVGQATDAALGVGTVQLAAIGTATNYDARFDNFLLITMGNTTESP